MFAVARLVSKENIFDAVEGLFIGILATIVLLFIFQLSLGSQKSSDVHCLMWNNALIIVANEVLPFLKSLIRANCI